MRNYKKGYTKEFKQEQFYHPTQRRHMMSPKNFVLWCQESVAPYIKPTMNGHHFGHWKIKELFLNRTQGNATRRARKACWRTENHLATALLNVTVPTENNGYSWERSAIDCATLIRNAYDSLEASSACFIALKPQITINEYDDHRGTDVTIETEAAKYQLVTKISAELVNYCEKQILKGQENYSQEYDTDMNDQRHHEPTRQQLQQNSGSTAVRTSRNAFFQQPTTGISIESKSNERATKEQRKWYSNKTGS